jgi:hypothetical protein
MNWNSKKSFVNIILYTVLVIGIYGLYLVGKLEKSIQFENNHTKTEIKKNPLEIKGNSYFVTNKDLHDYKQGKNLFWLGLLGVSILIIGKKKIATN